MYKSMSIMRTLARGYSISEYDEERSEWKPVHRRDFGAVFFNDRASAETAILMNGTNGVVYVVVETLQPRDQSPFLTRISED